MARVLLTGVTGYVGGRLLPKLLDAGHEVRGLSRRQHAPLAGGVQVARANPVSGDGLDAALKGIEVAYYLIHSMGRRSGPTASFAQRDRDAAENFRAAADRAGVRRIVYLGGLGGQSGGSSEHLRSRHQVAGVLGEGAAQLVYARAAMVIGAGSASFAMLDSLARRLPAMVCPRWIETRTQPIAIADVVGALALAAVREDLSGEIELAGADVLSYREMMVRMARLLGRRPPLILRVPVLTPRLSSYWVSLVTPVEAGLARPLIDGLSEQMLMGSPPPPGINDAPLGFEEAVRAALKEAARA
ncbi:MAG: NAD(P)H-binding protein [Solirubrobacteraceae bacterium]